MVIIRVSVNKQQAHSQAVPQVAPVTHNTHLWLVTCLKHKHKWRVADNNSRHTIQLL